MIKPAVAITLGDPTGIGPEIVKKSASASSVLKICRPVVIGTSAKFIKGFPTRKSDKAARSFLIRALKLVRNKKVDAIVTAPLAKSAFVKSGGHTEFLAKRTVSKNVEMLMIADTKKVLLLTRHIPLKDVSKNISKEKIVKSVGFVCKFIGKYFKTKKPKIIICGLNPHCGDGGLVGTEEKKKIIPAIKILKKKGLNVAGPVNPEVAFSDMKADLIVCMYHDQAMLPLKLLNPDKIVNVTVGLPFVRTSPGHGTAYDIAGKNTANPQSMIEAIKLACLLTKDN